MCLIAIYWARPDKVYYGRNHVDIADLGFDGWLLFIKRFIAKLRMNLSIYLRVGNVLEVIVLPH